MIQADYHMHTSFSTDSLASVESMIEAAISNGLKYCCITDHMDYDYPSHQTLPSGKKEFELNPEAYFTALTHYKEIYKKQIDIGIGIELGLRNEPQQKEKTKSYYQKLLSLYPFDFCIGSTHVLNYIDPYESEYWRDKPEQEALNDYFLSNFENINFYNDFQVYGHFDYIVRYFPSGIRNYLLEDYLDIIDLGLKKGIEKGIGIECNTSGYAHGLSNPHPKLELLKRYRKLGGEIITIGSDAHSPKQVARNFKQAEELLKEAGFRYYTLFHEKESKFIPF